MVITMSMASVNRIDDFVRTLSPDELRVLATKLEYNGSVATGSADLTPSAILFWDSMREAISSVHLDAPGFSARERDNVINGKQIGRAVFEECATALSDYVTHACDARINQTQRRAVYVEVLTCLIKWMRGNRSMIRPASICREIGALPHAVNICYPGYVQSRLLHMIVPRNVDNGRIARVA